MANLSASPATVRAALGLDKSTGRLSRKDIEVFNKGKAPGQRYIPGAYVKTFKHTAKPAKGRSVTRTISVPEVRAAALAAGVPVGARGKVPAPVLDAFVLGTLGSLAQSE